MQVWTIAAGRFVDWARDTLKTTVEIVRKPADHRGFAVHPRRWVVERTLAWLTACRRLARDYERRAEAAEALIRWAAIAGMTRASPADTPHDANRAVPSPDPDRNPDTHSVAHGEAFLHVPFVLDLIDDRDGEVLRGDLALTVFGHDQVLQRLAVRSGPRTRLDQRRRADHRPANITDGAKIIQRVAARAHDLEQGLRQTLSVPNPLVAGDAQRSSSANRDQTRARRAAVEYAQPRHQRSDGRLSRGEMPSNVTVAATDRADHDILAADAGDDRRRFEDVAGHNAQRRMSLGQLRAITNDRHDVMAAIERLAQDATADHSRGAEKRDARH